MQNWIMPALTCCLVACASVGSHPSSLVGDWQRSDDLGEYSGAYVYSMCPDGMLVWTDLPADFPQHPLQQRCLGRWAATGVVLRWQSPTGELIGEYRRHHDGRYYCTRSQYYVPVYLVRSQRMKGITTRCRERSLNARVPEL